MNRRINLGYADRNIPEDPIRHLGWHCTGCGDTVTNQYDACQGKCELECVVCHKSVPANEINSKGVCCSCYKQSHLLHSDENELAHVHGCPLDEGER